MATSWPITAFRHAGTYLGIGIANLLRLFNPRMVVLGGSVTKAGALLFDPMQRPSAHALPALLGRPSDHCGRPGRRRRPAGCSRVGVTETAAW